MRSEELYKELAMSYYELTEYLKIKYGSAKCDYFPNEACRKKSGKVTRTGEGLFCHHIDEDKGGNLNDPFNAVQQPFKWQKAERLVYCNYLEHLLLHIKIAVLRQKRKLTEPENVASFFTTGGIQMICKDLNYLFTDNGSTTAWRQRCYEEISDNFNDYIILLNLIFYYIDKQYIGIKKPAVLKKGERVELSDCTGTILGIDRVHGTIKLAFDDKKERVFEIRMLFSCAKNKLSYFDNVELEKWSLARTEEKVCEQIYLRINNPESIPNIDQLYQTLLVDYRGYGFPQFTDDLLDKTKFGSNNVDEYIAKAFPSCVEPPYKIGNKKPAFWKGEVPNQVIKENCFYIVRVAVVFRIKEGKTPFVRTCNTLLRKAVPFCDEDEIYNHLNNIRRSEVLLSSDIYDSKTGQYYSNYENTKDMSVELCLTRDDYYLFLQNYNVTKLKVLDGCYFEDVNV